MSGRYGPSQRRPRETLRERYGLQATSQARGAEIG